MKKYENIGDRLTHLQEECAEVIHIICKIKRFGMNNYHPDDDTKTTNDILLLREIYDLRKRAREVELQIDPTAEANA